MLTCPGLPVRLPAGRFGVRGEQGPPCWLSRSQGVLVTHTPEYLSWSPLPRSQTWKLKTREDHGPWLSTGLHLLLLELAGRGEGSPNPCCRPEWRGGHSGLLGRL